jgi:hypothetical protein
MKIPTLHGLIRRRLLINFRVNPTVIQKSLPHSFRPKLHDGHAIAGICLIRLEKLRPVGVPAELGLSSENAAHRIAVEWTDGSGQIREGVFIHRRDTDSHLAHFAGGRIFPGAQQLAKFHITDDGNQIDFAMRSRDGAVSIRVRGQESSALPASSCFATLTQSSEFFENGCVGFSPNGARQQLDGMRLQTSQWKVRAFSVSEVDSSWFATLQHGFPGTVEFDHALIMRDISHQWHSVVASAGPSPVPHSASAGKPGDAQ